MCDHKEKHIIVDTDFTSGIILVHWNNEVKLFPPNPIQAPPPPQCPPPTQAPTPFFIVFFVPKVEKEGIVSAFRWIGDHLTQCVSFSTPLLKPTAIHSTLPLQTCHDMTVIARSPSFPTYKSMSCNSWFIFCSNFL